MTITYLGANEEFDYRLAEIGTSTKNSVDKEKDAALLEKTISILEEMGWDKWNWFEDDYPFAQIEVFDREEYNELVSDYKVAKRMAKQRA